MVRDSLKYQRRGLAAIVLVILLLAVGVCLHIRVALRARRLGNQPCLRENAPGEKQQLLQQVSPVELQVDVGANGIAQ